MNLPIFFARTNPKCASVRCLPHFCTNEMQQAYCDVKEPEQLHSRVAIFTQTNSALSERVTNEPGRISRLASFCTNEFRASQCRENSKLRTHKKLHERIRQGGIGTNKPEQHSRGPRGALHPLKVLHPQKCTNDFFCGQMWHNQIQAIFRGSLRVIVSPSFFG